MKNRVISLITLTVRAKLTISFLIIALTPLVVLSFLNTRTTQTVLTEIANERLLNGATQAAANIDAFILTNLNVIRTEAQIPSLANYLSLSPEQQANPDRRNEAFAVLKSLNRKDPLNISAYKLLNKQGLNILGTGVEDVGQDKSHEDYFQNPRQNGLPFISTVRFLPTAADIYVFYFSSPIRNTNGDIVGVLAVEYNAAILQNLLTQVGNANQAGYFGALFDDQFIYLAHSTAPHFLYKSISPLSVDNLNKLQADRRIGQNTSHVPHLRLVEKLTNPDSFSLFRLEHTGQSDQPHRVAKALVQHQPWTVVFFQPEDILLAPIQAQTQTALQLGLIIMALVVAVAFLLTYSLTRPILALTEVAKRITTGDLNVQAKINTKDEIGLLAQTFNSMTVQLRESLEGLEQYVAYLEETQKALHQSEAEARKLSLVASRTSNMVIITDHQIKIEWVNEAFTEITGYTLAEVQGESSREFLSGADSDPMIKQQIATKIEQSEQFQVEIINYTKNQEPYWVDIDAQPIFDETGQLSNYIEVIRDITAHKRAEERQNQLLHELANINQELTNFAYVVSHDLKAPLRGIGSLSSWLLSDYGDKLDDEGKELLDLLMGRVKRMEGLINGILQYSRVGRIKEAWVEVDLSQLVPATIELLAPPDHIEIKVIDPLPIVRGQATRLEQLLQNLINNALKFMDKPQGIIEIGCTTLEQNWQFRITDNGPGIDEKYFDKIFEIFQTLQARDEFESSGIGLALVKKIIELHNGTVWVSSTVGQGASFFFTLPFLSNFDIREIDNEKQKTDFIS